MNNKKQETNSSCCFYNWGGDGTKERPSYPTAYGARCEKYNEFFCRTEKGLYPNCSACKFEEVKK
jgi:hypothetical protein